MLWLWLAVSCLALVVFLLLIKLYLLRKSAKEIENAFTEKLRTGSNTLIDLSSRDPCMCSLANTINIQLRRLRRERRNFQQGDLELKNAVTNISHDLRTPLTAINGYLELLEQEEKSPALSHYLTIIQDRADLLTQLTEELFRYSVILSTKGSMVLEPVVINTVLEESIAAFYAVLKERGIVPQIQMPNTKISRSLDRSALSRVFSNLLSNAIKYSDGDLAIPLTEDGTIIFSNTASRLDKIQAGRLFDRFYTVEAARKSTGLGLSISKTLVEKMGGTIRIQYRNGRLFIFVHL